MNLAVKRLIRQVQANQEQVNWQDKTSCSKARNPEAPSHDHIKGLHKNECSYCGARPSHPSESVMQLYLSTRVGTVARKKYMARKCMKKKNRMYSKCSGWAWVWLFTKHAHLFTLDIHSVRAVSGQKGKKFFATIKLTAARKHFVWKALQLDTAVDNLWGMC